MASKRFLLGVLLGVVALTVGTTSAGSGDKATVRLALDWTPNTNHTGFFVAKSKGFYDAAGINFKILPYSGTATDTLVANGKAECGINFEDFMTIAVAAGTPEVSVMAILQHDPLAVMVLQDSRFKRPRDLDGARYGGVGLPGEKEILQAIIRKDGGKGDFKFVTLQTAAYDAVYKSKVDFAAGFRTWEIIEARLRGIKLRLFPYPSYGIPDMYEVVLACNRDWLAKNPDVAKRFVAATVKGWTWARAHPRESADVLIKENPDAFTNKELVYESNKLLARSYWADARGRFGCQTLAKWTAYPTFLYKANVLKGPNGKALSSPPSARDLFTNQYLPQRC